MFTADALVAHLVGDYLLQSDWMAATKVKSWRPALAHALSYTLPFLLLTRSPLALLVIAGTHFIIDHWRLARYVCWAKNFLAPKWLPASPPDAADVGSQPAPLVRRNYDWAECQATGYGPDKQPWMSVWLLIFADNTLHVIANGLALHYAG